jgi:hypothetical protein
MFSVDPYTASFWGARTVPVAVGCVSRPTFLRISSRVFACGLARLNSQTGKTVFGETPNTARETPALPKTANFFSDSTEIVLRNQNEKSRHLCLGFN